MKILFIGCVESSKNLLSTLLEQDYEVCGIITKEQSGFNADFYDLRVIGEEYGIPTLYVKNVNDEESIQFIRDLNPDVIYCFGWSQLLKQELLNIPKSGVYGFHPAALPANKGRHPIIWALALGLQETAVTFFEMSAAADAGKIVSQHKISIAYEDDARSLYDKIMDEAKKQVVEFSAVLRDEGSLKEIVSNDGGNVWRKRGRKDGVIDWRMSGRAIYNLVRALTKPYVGAEFEYEEKVIKVWKVEECEFEGTENLECGKVLKVNSETDFYVKVYDKVIHVVSCDPIELKEGDYL